MIDKTPPPDLPAHLAELLPWAWVAFVSILGGVASFLQKMKTGHVRAWNFTEFVGEMAAAGLTGIITANLCDSMGSSAPLKYALVGISSHMGSRALFKLEAMFTAKFHLPADPVVPADQSKGEDHAA
jgi:hypothetical protein